MDSHEHSTQPRWDAAVAVPLFAELARAQITNGIFAGYVRNAQAYIESWPTGYADAEELRRSIYMELPLAVIPGELMVGGDERIGLFLVKIDPLSGYQELDSFVFTGFAFDEESGEVSAASDEYELQFTIEEANHMYEQLQVQEAAGLYIQ